VLGLVDIFRGRVIDVAENLLTIEVLHVPTMSFSILIFSGDYLLFSITELKAVMLNP
jgi:hypothetical protein